MKSQALSKPLHLDIQKKQRLTPKLLETHPSKYLIAYTKEEKKG